MSENERKVDGNGLTRRGFLKKIKTGVIGFGIYSATPSLFSINLAVAGLSNDYEPGLSDGLGFYGLIRKKKASAPLFVTLDIQPFKTLNERIEGKGRGEDLTLPEVHGLIKQMGEMKVLRLTFLGDSPFSNPSLIDLIKLAEGHNISTSAISSGLDLKDSDIEQISQIPFFNVKFNLDGATASTHDRFWGRGSFNATQGAIGKCVAKGINVTVVTYATAVNSQEVEKIVSLARDLGANTYNLRRYISVDPENKSAKTLEISPLQAKELLLLQGKLSETFKSPTIVGVDPLGGSHDFFVRAGVVSQRRNRYAWNVMCQSGTTYFHITSTGKVLPCTWLPVVCGDVKKEGLASIWEKSTAFESLRGRKSFDECIADSYLEKGDMLAVDPLKWS